MQCNYAGNCMIAICNLCNMKENFKAKILIEFHYTLCVVLEISGLNEFLEFSGRL